MNCGIKLRLLNAVDGDIDRSGNLREVDTVLQLTLAARLENPGLVRGERQSLFACEGNGFFRPEIAQNNRRALREFQMLGQ